MATPRRSWPHPVAELWGAYRQALTGQSPDDPNELPDDPVVLSYLVAAATILDLSDKQRLLEEPDTTSRLRRELAILRREAILLRLLPVAAGGGAVRERR